jgi:hypothetical protein
MGMGLDWKSIKGTSLAGDRWYYTPFWASQRNGKESSQQAAEQFLCQAPLNKRGISAYKDEAAGVSTKPYVRYVYTTILIGKKCHLTCVSRASLQRSECEIFIVLVSSLFTSTRNPNNRSTSPSLKNQTT